MNALAVNLRAAFVLWLQRISMCLELLATLSPNQRSGHPVVENNATNVPKETEAREEQNPCPNVTSKLIFALFFSLFCLQPGVLECYKQEKPSTYS